MISGLASEGEDIRVNTIAAADLKDMLEKGQLKNGVAITALQSFFLFHYEGLKTL